MPLMEGFDLAGTAVLGDKAYGTVEILNYIRSNGGTVVIPPKSNTVDPWECDFYHYKERHLVECFFNKLKHFRRVLQDTTSFLPCFKPLFFSLPS